MKAKLVKENLEDVFQPKEEVDIVNDIEEEVKEYFDDYGVDITPSFSLKEFAEYHDLTIEVAYTYLLNLEDEDIMYEIAKGSYEEFDEDDESQFNDGYDQMMYDLEYTEYEAGPNVNE